MTPRLRNRQMQIPNGLTFFEPCTGWTPRQYSSFSTIVAKLIASRTANPHLTRTHNLATQQQAVEAEVDLFNAKICLAQGWMDYIMTEERNAPSVPKQMPPQQSSALSAAAGKARRLWQGVKTINEWYDSKEPAVSAEQSGARAKICSECPMNLPGDFTRWFTSPAAEAIKRQVEKFSDRKLSTPYDDKLNVCDACLCVNKLSVHAPLHLKLAHMTPDTRALLHPQCWVLAEEKAAKG